MSAASALGPKSDGLAADGYTAFSEQVFNITMAKIEPVIEQNCVRNDVRWESVAFVCIHRLIVPISVH